MAIGDISGARLLLERAAEGGSGRAALQLGISYDPRGLDALGVRGIRPDLALARRWYERAAALGETEATTRLRDLNRPP